MKTAVVLLLSVITPIANAADISWSSRIGQISAGGSDSTLFFGLGLDVRPAYGPVGFRFDAAGDFTDRDKYPDEGSPRIRPVTQVGAYVVYTPARWLDVNAGVNWLEFRDPFGSRHDLSPAVGLALNLDVVEVGYTLTRFENNDVNLWFVAVRF